MKHFPVFLIVSFFQVTSAQADMEAYKNCKRKFVGDELVSGLSMAFGVLKFDALSFLGGAYGDRAKYDKIREVCWPLLSEQEKEALIEESLSGVRAYKWDQQPK